MKILFIADQFVPPVYDGSTAVYQSWLKTLKSVGEVYAILFTQREAPTAETHSYLSQTCRDYLILRGHAGSQALKTARALGRYVNKSLFAHSMIEEFNRRQIKRAISRFISAHGPDVAVVSKLDCVHLVGYKLLAGLRIPKFIDLHDDFVRREKLSRQIINRTLSEFPSLAGDSYFRLKRIRQRLSRFDYDRARRQEFRLLDLFDRIMISSYEEYSAYSARDGVGDRCVHLPWPMEVDFKPLKHNGTPDCDAGLISAGNEFNLEGLSFMVRKVMPLVRKQRPGFRLLLVGNITSSFLMTGLPTEGLVLGGEVKEPSDFYKRIKVSVVPLLNGTGVSLKALEGLRYGLPVVATSVGARGLIRQDLPNLHLADTPETFADTIVAHLDDYTNGAGDAHRNGSARSQIDQLERFVQICKEAGVKG